MGTLTGTIRSIIWVEGKTTAFKSHKSIPYSTSIAVKGLSGSEKIAIEVFVADNDADKNDDANWVAASFNGTALELEATKNVVLIEGRAIYRLNLSSAPANPITVVYYD